MTFPPWWAIRGYIGYSCAGLVLICSIAATPPGEEKNGEDRTLESAKREILNPNRFFYECGAREGAR